MNSKEQILKIKINELEKLNTTQGVVKRYTWRCLVFAIIGLPASIYFIYMSNINHLRVDYTSNNSLAPYTGPVYGISDGGRISGCEKIGYILNTGNLHTTAQKSHINSDIH